MCDLKKDNTMIYFTKILYKILIIMIASIAINSIAISQTKELISPDLLVSEYYKWYLVQISSNKDPINDDLYTIEKYVSKELIKEIKQKMNSQDGLEADYFIQAQDYLDDWINNIYVTKPVIKNNMAKLIVTLGNSKI